MSRKLSIARIGNPILRKKASPVPLKEIKTAEFQVFLDNLVHTCIVNKGVGIAAPQVSVDKRIIVVYVDRANPRYKNKKSFPVTIVINPKIHHKSTEVSEDWEGDLSCGLRAMVPRSKECTVVGYDRSAKRMLITLGDPFHARIFQHEIDHLDGILYLDRVKNLNTISEIKEWKKYWKK